MSSPDESASEESVSIAIKESPAEFQDNKEEEAVEEEEEGNKADEGVDINDSIRKVLDSNADEVKKKGTDCFSSENKYCRRCAATGCRPEAAMSDSEEVIGDARTVDDDNDDDTEDTIEGDR